PLLTSNRVFNRALRFRRQGSSPPRSSRDWVSLCFCFRLRKSRAEVRLPIPESQLKSGGDPPQIAGVPTAQNNQVIAALRREAPCERSSCLDALFGRRAASSDYHLLTRTGSATV